MGGEEKTVDYEAIAQALEVLSNPNRLRALRQLLTPRKIGEIELEAQRSGGAGAKGATVSREGVRQHLARLHELGVVQRRDAEGGGHEYIVDQGRLFALTEDIRQLGRLRPRERWSRETMHGGLQGRASEPGGPRLVVVHGVEEGQAFGLGSGQDPWIIGRAPGCEVTVDHDPFVSRENTRIELGGDGFEVSDLPSSRNGTTLNWRPLEAEEPAELEHGDVLGVGRTLLLFRA